MKKIKKTLLLFSLMMMLLISTRINYVFADSWVADIDNTQNNDATILDWNKNNKLGNTSIKSVEYNGKLYLAWVEKNSSGKSQVRVCQYDGNNQIFIDGDSETGLNFKPAAETVNVYDLTIAVSNGTLYVGWYEWSTGDPNGTFSHISKYNGVPGSWTRIDGGDGYGIRFDKTVDLNTSPYSYNLAKGLSLIDYNDTLYAVWSEVGNGKTPTNVVLSKYDGASWITINPKLNSNIVGVSKDLCVYNNELYIAYEEGANSGNAIQVKKYNAGTNALTDVTLGASLNYDVTAQSGHDTKLATDGTSLYAVWNETTLGGKNQIRAKKYDGTSWSSIDGNGAGGINFDTSKNAYNTSVRAYDGDIYVSWYENNVTQYQQMRIKKYDPQTGAWSFVDDNGLTGGVGLPVGMNMYPQEHGVVSNYIGNYNNELYIFWAENDKLYAKKYDNNWDIAADAADLSSLQISDGDLYPIFDSNTKHYSVVVENTVENVTVTPTVTEPDATVTVNGNPVPSGSVSQNIALNVGSNDVVIEVTSHRGVLNNKYVVKFVRYRADGKLVLTPTEDVCLYNDGTVTNYGTDTLNFVGYMKSSSSNNHAYEKFDYSFLQGGTITAASFGIFIPETADYYGTPNAGVTNSPKFDFYYSNDDTWDEMSTTIPANAGDIATDVTMTAGTTPTNDYYMFNQAGLLTAVNGSSDKIITLVLEGDTSGDGNVIFYSDDSSINKPQLLLTYIAPTNLVAYNAALSAVKEADYTQASWSAYQIVVAANVVTQENTQAEVDAAVNNITTAQGSLIFAGKEALETAKAAAGAKVQATYTSGSWTKFINAMTTANAMPEATNELIVAKTKAINDAIALLVIKADITAYNQALLAVKEADYTQASWSAYQIVVAANVVTQENTQAEVDAAVSAITTAQGSLVFAGKEALETAKAVAGAKVQATYTLVSWTKFSNAMTTANVMPETTNEYIVAKTKSINDAIAMLVLKADMTAYDQALSAVKEADYTQASWSAYQIVVAANVVTTENTQVEVNAAVNNIKLAQSSLVLKADMTAYDQALSAVKEADYTQASWSAYQIVVAANVVTTENTQAEIDAAVNNITTAQGSLIFAGKEALETAKTAAGAKVQTTYTLGSWTKFINAMTTANAMSETTNELIVAKTKAINDAIALLVTKADITAYNQALLAVKEADYTQPSWTAYQIVVAANVVTQENTQTEVDAAVSTITTAQGSLVFAGKDALETAKAVAGAKVQAAYTLVSWTKFSNAMTTANVMSETTNEYIVAKTKSINDAIAMLVLKADMTAYNQALSAVKEADYTQASWSTYQIVVAANIVTIENTQAEVDAAVNNIKLAQSNLVLKADMTAYNQALSAVKEADYTQASWSAYQIVVAANVVTQESTQTEVNTALNNIKMAQSSLVKIIDANLVAAKSAEKLLVSADYVDYSAVTIALALPEGTDTEKTVKTNAINDAIKALVKKSNLTAYYSALSAVNETEYTVVSWREYQVVVASNTVTVSDSQVKVDAATAAIISAQKNLVKQADADLVAAKAEAVIELNDYKSSSNYSTENWMLIEQKKQTGKSAINNAISIQAVSAALIASKADIDTVNTISVTYSVTYYGNGSDNGVVPEDKATYVKGAYARVMSSGSLAKIGYTFNNWNTASDGSGINYKLNDTVAVSGNLTLYAQWAKIIEAKIPVITSSNVRGTEVVTQNDSATQLSVTAYVSDGGTLSYQWYQVTSQSAISGEKINGAISSKYLPSTTETGIFSYYVVVKNTVNINGETKAATNKSSVREIVVVELAPAEYKVSLNGGTLSGNVKLSGSTTQTAIQYQNYTATLVSDIGYSLPNNIKVSMNGITLTPDIDYIYSKATGSLKVYNVSGDVSVTALGVLIPAETYTITFNSNGGSSISSITGSYGTPIVIQTPVKQGYNFGGWYRDSNFATSFILDKMSAENIVLYAKWEDAFYTISGNVKTSSNVNVAGRIIKLMAGSREIASVTTNANGNFSISGVLKGSYNLVITNEADQTMTLTVTVNDSNVTTGTITLPEGNKNSAVEVKEDTPDIVVDKLNSFFESTKFSQDDKNVVDSGGTVEIKLTVEKKEESGDNAAANANLILNAAGSEDNVGMLFEISLNKVITSQGGTSEKPVEIDELDDVLTINIPLSDELIGKDEYYIYRYHNNEVNKITRVKNSDGEYIELSSDGRSIKLHAKKFSTYAIAFSMNSSSGGNSGSGGNSASAAVITVEDSNGGRIVMSDKTTASINSDDGYVIADVTVDGKSIGACKAYVFSDGKSHKISAKFVKESTVPYYMQNGEKVFVGFSGIIDNIFKYTVPDGVNVEFTENSKNFTDVKNHWAESSIDFVAERELFLGTLDGSFSPDKGMTRAMLVTVIGRLYERSYGNAEGNTSFTDVDKDAYYADYVAWAHENGIIKGVGSNSFMPDAEITREQMAEIMFRFAKYLDKGPKGMWMINITYKDKDEISEWAVEASAYSQLSGIITGRSDGEFAPKDKVTRAEVSAIIERYMNYLYK